MSDTKLKTIIDAMIYPTSPFGIPMPVVCIPRWDRDMGFRLSEARKWLCPRVDRRTSDWRHQEHSSTIHGSKCICISQVVLARKLSLSQSAISSIELGKSIDKMIDVRQLLSALNGHYGLTYYVLTGCNFEELEAETAVKAG